VLFEFNRLKSIQETESVSTTLQVIKGGRLGSATSTRPGAGEELLAKAAALSEFGAPVAYRLPDVEPSARPVMYHDRAADLTLDAMLEAGDDLTRFLKALHPDVNGSARLVRTVSSDSIRNTRGLDSSWRNTAVTTMASLRLVEVQNMVEFWEHHASTDLEFGIEALKSKIKGEFDLARRNVPVETGVYDVVFTHEGFSDLLSPILQCLDGKAVVRGVSPFKDRLGEQAFSPVLTIVEDGVLDGGLRSRLYDRQGVACRRTPLVSQGVLSEYLLDLETAAKLGRKPTGTGGVAGIERNNILVLPGDLSVADLINSLKRGIIIDATMGAWAGNPYSGQVTGNIALGYLVVDGQPVGRVKDCMFSVNVFTALKDNLAALSRETKNLGDAILPYALVRSVSISAKKG
jgi:PmbA protein